MKHNFISTTLHGVREKEEGGKGRKRRIKEGEGRERRRRRKGGEVRNRE